MRRSTLGATVSLLAGVDPLLPATRSLPKPKRSKEEAERLLAAAVLKRALRAYRNLRNTSHPMARDLRARIGEIAWARAYAASGERLLDAVGVPY